MTLFVSAAGAKVPGMVMQPAIERRNAQAKISLLERFGKTMSKLLARAEVSGIVMELAVKVGAPEEVGNPQWAIMIR